MGVEEQVRTLQLQLAVSNADVAAALHRHSAEQSDWAATAAALTGLWRDAQAELRAAQAEEARLRGEADPFVLSAEGEVARHRMAADLTAEYRRRAEAVEGGGEGRRVLGEVANGRWRPVTLTVGEVREALKEEGVGREGGRVEVKALMRRWGEEMGRVRGEVEAAATDARRMAGARAVEEVEGCEEAQRRLHADIARLQQRVASAGVGAVERAPRVEAAATTFALYRRPVKGGLGGVWGAEEEGERPLTPLPALQELEVDEDEEDGAGDGGRGLQGMGVGDGQQQTPAKGMAANAAVRVQSPPAYMGGGGLLDDLLQCEE